MNTESEPKAAACTDCAGAVPVNASSISTSNADLLTLKIDNMDCAAEEALIRKALDQPEIAELNFDLVNRQLAIRHRGMDPATILAALTNIGMRVTTLNAVDKQQKAPIEDAPRVSRRAWLLTLGAGVAALGAEGLALATDRETSWPVGLLCLLAIALSGLPTLRKAWFALKTFTLNINLLMAVAVLGAVIIGEWPEAAVVIWLFSIAELIEVASLDRARNAIRGLMALAPETALVQQPDGKWSEAAAATIALGAVVRVRPGERIVLDGQVLSGDSAVNQAPITGESLPVAKTTGDKVFAGSINERGTLEFRVTAAKGETTLDRIARAVQAAQGQRAPTQRFVDQFARIYTPVIFVLAILMALVPPLLFDAAWYAWTYKALVLLVIACPCALVISTPVTIVSGLAAAARLGMVIKGGLYLEQGSRMQLIALDKTGTLTHGKPVLTDVVPLANLDRDAVLKIAASLDALSEHPIATAIVQGHGAGALAVVSDFESLPGRGVQGRIDGAQYSLGNHRLIKELGLSNPALEAQLALLEQQAKSAVVLVDGQQVLAVLAVADTLRDTSRHTIDELKALGVEPVMLTGDNDQTAQAIAAQVGIAEARGNLLPEDKLKAITAMQARGVVGMVGDGVNDAPALAKADIGFAMGAAGTDTAIETADVALMQDDLRKLPQFIRLSRATRRILRQNITLALAIKFVFFALTLTGQATLWMAVFADMGASLLVMFNGLRLLRIRV